MARDMTQMLVTLESHGDVLDRFVVAADRTGRIEEEARKAGVECVIRQVGGLADALSLLDHLQR